MDLMANFRQKARANKQKIVLPEGNELRILKAAAQILAEEIAELVILGEAEEIRSIADKEELELAGAKIINPKESSFLEKFTDDYFKIRQSKGISKTEASRIVKDSLYFGTLMIYNQMVDGMVAGSINATGDVLRPGFQIIKTKAGVSLVSGAFIMQVPNSETGKEDIYVFADCAVNPQPNAKQLAEIAVSTAETAKTLLNLDVKVALLSFSTQGSAQHKLVEKVQEASRLAQAMAPDLNIEGELQLDAAIVPAVAKKKAKDSKVAGEANILIFPDLQSGNIGYKLVERMANAKAIGPVLQGIAKPINDLSRGCSVEDIVNLVAITGVQAQNSNNFKGAINS